MSILTPRSHSRSKWKFLYTSIYPLNLSKFKLNRTVEPTMRRVTYVFDRSSTVLSAHIGCTFKVHKGMKFHKRKVTKEMVGFKFGEFNANSKMGGSIHKDIKKKNKSKRR